MQLPDRRLLQGLQPESAALCLFLRRPRAAAGVRVGLLVALALTLAHDVSAAAETPRKATLRERIAERREAQDGPEAEAPPRPFGVGTHTLELAHEGRPRKVVVHVPAAVTDAAPAALVVALHGGGGHAEFMADEGRYGLVGKADREGFIVVFPNGTSRLPGGRLATWNAGDCCGDARDGGADDVGFIRALIEWTKQRANIDGARIFAAGMSNGGMLAHRLACDASDVFRAVASVAGTDATVSCSPERPVSVLHVHARNDTHVLFEGGAGRDAFHDPSKVMDFVSVPETISRWVKRNRCATTPRRVLETPGAYCDLYSGCDEGVTVQVCVSETGGHSWPGAAVVRRGKEEATKALDANDVIWSFFAASAPR